MLSNTITSNRRRRTETLLGIFVSQSHSCRDAILLSAPLFIATANQHLLSASNQKTVLVTLHAIAIPLSKVNFQTKCQKVGEYHEDASQYEIF